MRPVPNFERCFEAALDWAGRKHAEKNQTWAGGRPYREHLVAVAEVLRRFGFSDPANPIHQNLQLAAVSHDLLEDTSVHPDTIRVLQGPDVLVLVRAVTNSPGRNRAERHAGTYPRIAGTPWATLLKLADRIANLEVSIETGSSHLRMYQAEMGGFREALYVAGGPEEPLWAHLEGLLASQAAPEPPASAPLASAPPPPAQAQVALPLEPWF